MNVEISKDRRQFLEFMGRMAVGSLGTALLTSCSRPQQKGLTGLGSPFLSPSRRDDLLLAEGLRSRVLLSWKDPINRSGDTFGDQNDFTSFMLAKDSPDEGYLWVNHESVNPWALHGFAGGPLHKRNRDQVRSEQYQVGGSILKMKRTKGVWQHDISSSQNRRIHGYTTIPFSGSTSIMNSKKAVGTLANCCGGQTPWGTFLTSEENFQSFYGDVVIHKKKRSYKPSKRLAWHDHFPFPPEHYGWVVEVDPVSGKAEKLIHLGRARHEGATVTLTKNGKAVVYMGEDRVGGFIFKFVSDGKHLQSGTLYAADTIKGRWVELNIAKTPILQEHFRDQTEVLTYSHDAAMYAGATPMDRPEDIEVDPKTGAVIVSLTYNPTTTNKFGSLFKINENGDHDSTEFSSKNWILGSSSTFSCPDNLAFDKGGNLWMTCDISEKNLGKGPYKNLGNNALYVIPSQGPQAGTALQVASAPVDAELTGPWFTPDGNTLFLSVQHPGSQGIRNGTGATSHWPKGGSSMALSSVVAIEGDLLKKIGENRI